MKRLLLAAFLAISGLAQASGFDVALTVDDLPAHGKLPPGRTRLDIAEAHLRAFKAFGVPEAWGFVNARGLTDADGDSALSAWRRAGQPLGNHSFSHMNLGRAASLDAWQADVAKGEPLVAQLMAGDDWRWFRYPNLSVGDGERRDAALVWLRQRGYRIADVSLAFSDWDYTDAYARCKSQGDEAAVAAMKAHYLRGVEAGIAQALAESRLVYGRVIPLVLLTHMGAFSADTLPEVLSRLKAAGARFVPLAQAQADPAYERFGGGSLITREARARGVALPARPAAEPLDLKALCGQKPAWPNPLVPQRADPQVLRHGDWYYLMATVPEYDRLELRRARSLAGLATAEPRTIWRQHADGPMSRHIWAPELHVIDGRWFVYFSAGEAKDPWKIRLWVLENGAADPFAGEWTERGQIKTQWETFTLDATVFEHRGARYMAWAQNDPASGNHSTNLYLSRMASPTQLQGPQVLLSRPEHAWEQVRHKVNEAPAVLVKNGRVFIAYSAAGTGAEYSLGLLWADENADLLDARSWRKSAQPVFTSSEANGIWGPGHNSFVTEPDGTVLNVYHARNYRDIAGDPLKDTGRATRVQRLDFDAQGMPVFGVPEREQPR